MSLSDPDIAEAAAPPARQAWTGRVLCFAACVLAVNGLIGERGLSETLRARQRIPRRPLRSSRELQYENAVLAETDASAAAGRADD